MRVKRFSSYKMHRAVSLRAIKPFVAVEKTKTAELVNKLAPFLANVNSRSRSLYVIVSPSVVCNVRAPYSGD